MSWEDEDSITKYITPQKLLAGVFIGLGSWCVISPRSMLDLSVNPESLIVTPLTTFLARCFGAQAILAGTLLGKNDLNLQLTINSNNKDE